MALKAGDKIPTDVSFLTLENDAPTPLGYEQIFANKKVHAHTSFLLSQTCARSLVRASEASRSDLISNLI
jgi:hypothetical protein